MRCFLARDADDDERECVDEIDRLERPRLWPLPAREAAAAAAAAIASAASAYAVDEEEDVMVVVMASASAVPLETKGIEGMAKSGGPRVGGGDRNGGDAAAEALFDFGDEASGLW